MVKDNKMRSNINKSSKNENKLKRKEQSESDSESGDDDDFETIDSSNEDDESEITEEVVKPKYKSRKTEQDSDDDVVECRKYKKSHNKKDTSHKSKKRHIKEESSDEDSDEESYDSDDDEKDNKDARNLISLFLGGGFDEDEDEEDIEKVLNDEDDECNSEDEKMFMKEKYENNNLSKELTEKIQKNQSETTTKSNDKSSKKKSLDKKNTKSLKTVDGKNKDKDKEKEPDEVIDVEADYKELNDLKKMLCEKLEKNPKSKFIFNALSDCKNSINELVKTSRTKNTKEYYDLVNVERKTTGEIEYFKKKLSHQEQLKIMKELKDINEHIHIDKPYRLSLLQSNIPAKYKATVLQKLNVMRSIEPGESEYHKMKTWVDTFMRIPFGKYKSLSVSVDDGMDACDLYMRNSKETLDNCVYGLEDAKMQIMQMVGQWITNPSAMGTAIAISGPPGTAKSTLVKEGISKILGREFAFIALGGAGDSSFLEGHSYTYEGSSWGKIVQILIDSKCMNPVIYFDELDKISDTPRGQEISGILTHLTDTTQNEQFHEKYFSDVDFDLSKCLFIFSYNDETNINPILKDRMYQIKTKGYTPAEKVIIAKKYMLPKIREQVNFKEGDIIIPDETIQYLVTNTRFTKGEEGVRNLKRCLEIIHTKLNLFRLMRTDSPSSILGKNVDIKVVFPYTVGKKDVDILIKNDENQNQSMLAMYV